MTGAPHAGLSASDAELRGHWTRHADGSVTVDAVDERIRWLTTHQLEPLGSASDGWDWLFRDPRDGRLWELTFPEGSLHGSGPRLLRVVIAEDALARYGLA